MKSAGDTQGVQLAQARKCIENDTHLLCAYVFDVTRAGEVLAISAHDVMKLCCNIYKQTHTHQKHKHVIILQNAGFRSSRGQQIGFALVERHRHHTVSGEESFFHSIACAHALHAALRPIKKRERTVMDVNVDVEHPPVAM